MIHIAPVKLEPKLRIRKTGLIESTLVWLSIALISFTLIASLIMVALLHSPDATKTIESQGSIALEGNLRWLHVEGKFIVDDQGRRIALRGGSTMYNSEGDRGLQQWVEGPDADGETPGLFLRKGLNLMRLGFAPYTIANGAFKEVNITLLEQNINYLGSHGIYSIINPHGFWADWSFVPGGKYPTPDGSSGRDYTLKKWREIATRLKDNPNLAAYEIYNEPWQGPVPEMRQFLLDTINTIRSIDTRHIIVHPELLNGGAWEIRNYLDGRGLMLWDPTLPHGEAYNMMGSVHWNWLDLRFFYTTGVYDYMTGRDYVNDANDYGNPGVGKPLYTQQMALTRVAQGMDIILTYRDLMNEPVWNGELNLGDYTPSGINIQVYAREMIQQSEMYGVPWVWHELEKFTSYSSFLADYGSIYDDMIPQSFAPVLNGTVRPTYYHDYVPLPFGPNSFNLQDHVVGYTYKDTMHNRWDAGRFQINLGWFVDIKGPVKVRIRGWSNGYYSSDSIIDRDEIITIPEQNITRILSTSSVSDVYPYEDLSVVHGGLYSSHSVVTCVNPPAKNVSYKGAYAYKLLSNVSNTVYVRFFVKFALLPPVNSTPPMAFGAPGTRILGSYGTGGELLRLYLINTDYDHTICWRAWVWDPSTGKLLGYATPYPMRTNNWYCIEYKYVNGPVNGEYRIWVDGQEIITLTGRNTSSFGNLNRVEVGVRISDWYNSEVYVDDVVVSDSYIGPFADPASYIFKSGFETGDYSEWSGITYDDGNTIQIVS